jgi:S-adenosylmethionine hydrolase
MILLFTDFGASGHYVGQLKTVLSHLAPLEVVVDLMHDAPVFSPRSAGYLLAALTTYIPPGSVVLAVVDPDVGTERLPLIVKIGEIWFVGPDNGLLAPAVQRANVISNAWKITWRPPRLSVTFHGRDLFAPVAAKLACGQKVPSSQISINQIIRPDWPSDLLEIIYIDNYGNAMTGLRVTSLPNADAQLFCGSKRLVRGVTFSQVEKNSPFWYENSLGLAELAISSGNAAVTLGLKVGDSITVG